MRIFGIYCGHFHQFSVFDSEGITWASYKTTVFGD